MATALQIKFWIAAARQNGFDASTRPQSGMSVKLPQEIVRE